MDFRRTMVLNTMMHELREHGQDTTLPPWFVLDTGPGVLGLYTSMVVVSARYIAATRCRSIQSTPRQDQCVVMAMVIVEATRYLGMPMSDAQAVDILEWMSLFVTIYSR